jgi:hypothetical protein
VAVEKLFIIPIHCVEDFICDLAGYTFLRFYFEFSRGKRVEPSRFPPENLTQKSIAQRLSPSSCPLANPEEGSQEGLLSLYPLLCATEL